MYNYKHRMNETLLLVLFILTDVKFQWTLQCYMKPMLLSKVTFLECFNTILSCKDLPQAFYVGALKEYIPDGNYKDSKS